jgi:periplasmic mercuric ion binding protein
MKTLQFLFLVLFVSIASVGFAQAKTEKIKVSGECGMCKSKIEKAAKTAGATYAEWSTDSKMLTVKLAGNGTNMAKIEQAVAGVGYDTQNVKATNDAYNNLHECCKYERTAATTTTASQSCCNHEKCTKAACIKDGKCNPDMSCCKDAGCDTKECCKKS